MRHPLTTLLLCLAAAAILGNLGVLAVHINHKMREERKEESDDRVKTLSLVKRDDGRKIVTLNPELAKKYGVQTQPARPCTWHERVLVYGRVVSNPRATYEVRAPFAGIVQAADKGEWPTVGETVRPGQPLGRLVIRIGPQERLDLANRLTEARLKRKGAEESSAHRKSLVERLEKAHRDSVVAERVVEDARVQLIEAETQLAVAQATENLLQQATDDIKRMRDESGLWSCSLTAPTDKRLSADLEVTELAGQPGMAVEAGGLIVRVVDFSRPLVRMDLPAGLLQDGPPPEDIELSAGEAPGAVKARRVGPAPQVDGASQFAGWFYALSAGKETGHSPAAWRPGFFVQARLPRTAGDTRQAVAVPATAILYHQGRTLLYVRTESDKYEKREVRVLGHEGECCILATTEIRPDEAIVSRQAQVLLAIEFREDADND